MAAQSEVEAENPSTKLLFDSAASKMAPQHFKPLRFIYKACAGSVLSVWANEHSLRCLSGEPLKEQMSKLGLLKNGALALPATAGLTNCLNQQQENFDDFTATWEVLGELLAHSSAGDSRFREVESEHGFLKFLEQFLHESFIREPKDVERELPVIEAQLFRKPIEVLLHSAYHPEHLLYPTRYEALTWPEYFAIKLLWWYAPNALLEITATKMDSIPPEPIDSDVMRLSLLSQVVSEISLSVVLDISEVQRELLIQSSNGLLKWLGLNAIEMRLEKKA